jgi:hypothetical protein
MLDFNPFKLFCLSDFIFIKIKFYKILNLQKNVVHFKLEAQAHNHKLEAEARFLDAAQARAKRAFALHYFRILFPYFV